MFHTTLLLMESDNMNLLQDIYFINKTSITKASKLIVKNWPIVFTGFIYSILNVILFLVLGILATGIMGLFAGIITFLAMSAMISNYLYLLYNVVKHGKVTVQDFKDGFKVYLRKIYSVLIIGWLASLLFNMIIAPILFTSGVISAGALSVLISLLVLLLLNALPETIYQKHHDSWGSIVYAFEFIKENWIEWIIPNAILMAILYYVTGNVINNIFAIQVRFSFNLTPSGALLYIIGQVLFTFIMIYRGVLFDILSTSTRRKRQYMRNMYK